MLLNAATAVFSAIGTGISFTKYGLAMFALYTVDSNIFAVLACTVYAIFLGRAMVSGKEMPVWPALLKYAAVCCLTVTFLVVVAVLAPMHGIDGYRMMLLSGDMLYHHLLAPILAALSFFLFDRVPLRPEKAAQLALLPTAVYAAVMILLNLMRGVTGPYPFLMVYAQPVRASVLWALLILGGAYAIAWLIARLRAQKA